MPVHTFRKQLSISKTMYDEIVCNKYVELQERFGFQITHFVECEENGKILRKENMVLSKIPPIVQSTFQFIVPDFNFAFVGESILDSDIVHYNYKSADSAFSISGKTRAFESGFDNCYVETEFELCLHDERFRSAETQIEMILSDIINLSWQCADVEALCKRASLNSFSQVIGTLPTT